MAAAKNDSEQLSPCSSGASASAEARRPSNKGLVSCLRKIFSKSRPAELATTSKIPHRGQAIPLASTSHCAQYNNECRSECAVLNGSIHGETSKSTQSQNMKHIFKRTTEEISECSSSANRLDHATSIPHVPTFDVLSSDSEEDEDHDDNLLDPFWDTILETDSIISPRPVSLPWSAWTDQQCTDLNVFELLNSWQTPPPSPPSFSQILTLVDIEEDEVHGASSTAEDTLQSSSEAWGQIPGCLDNLNVDDQDSSKELVGRPKPRLSESSNEEEKQCRICLGGDISLTNPLLTPCLCSGSLRYTHLDCLKKWFRARVQSGSRWYDVQKCELCMGNLKVDPKIFDWSLYFSVHEDQTHNSASPHEAEFEYLIDRGVAWLQELVTASRSRVVSDSGGNTSSSERRGNAS